MRVAHAVYIRFHRETLHQLQLTQILARKVKLWVLCWGYVEVYVWNVKIWNWYFV